MTSVCSPEDISKALLKALHDGLFHKLKKYIGRALLLSLLASLDVKVDLFTFNLETKLSEALKKEEANLESTINKFDKILTVLGELPVKPVIVIGTVQSFIGKAKNRHCVLFLVLLIFFFLFHVELLFN
jgi:hypothetical protein